MHNAPHIRPPWRIRPPLDFQSKFLHRHFYLINRPPQPWPCYQNSNMIFYRNSYTAKVSVVEWQCQNEASVHGTAEKFANDRKHVYKWCQSYSTLKGQTRRVLGKHHRLRCGQPLSVDLDHRISGGQEKRIVLQARLFILPKRK